MKIFSTFVTPDESFQLHVICLLFISAIANCVIIKMATQKRGISLLRRRKENERIKDLVERREIL